MRASPFLLLPFCHSAYAAQDRRSQVMNPLNAWKECSLKEKEWSICVHNEWGFYWFCPVWDDVAHDPLKNPTEFDEGTILCFQCPQIDPTYGSDCNSAIANISSTYNLTDGEYISDVTCVDPTNITENGLDYCTSLCESGLEDEVCSDENPCTVGSHYCDFSDDGEQSVGVCKECPEDINDCYADEYLASDRARAECFKCRLDCFDSVISSTLQVDGTDVTNVAMGWSAHESSFSASGTLVDCSNLILRDVDICPNAKDHVCLVEDFTQDTLYYDLSDKAEASGCVAIIKFDRGNCPIYHHSYDNLSIPFVDVAFDEGKTILNEKLGAVADIQSSFRGMACWHSWSENVCTEKVACTDDNTYCNFLFAVENGEYTEGWCVECPKDEFGEPDHAGCFFDRIGGYPKLQAEVESCAKSCNAKLASDNCKFCPNEVTGLEFSISLDESERCRFCPNHDVSHPSRNVPLFGKDIKCFNVQAFFERLDIPKDSQTCKVAQSMNYICGCEGTGYAGADTQAKQAALVWMPRVAAIISMMGSLFIVADTQRTRLKRSKTINKILCVMSIFDFIGSFAMAFTSYTTPKEDYIYGSQGSKETCTVQGFFIQMGTVACLIGASQALYYNLSIKRSWSEEKMRRKRMIYFLLIPPIIVGFTFACVGIPYYDNVMIWCNNSARWWPETPVIASIFFVTVLMGDMLWSVYKTEKATSKYTSKSRKLSKMVFSQAKWFVGSYYVTWVTYLVLQFLWSSGHGYNNYGLILTAATLVPLQGFWNFYVYVRPRYLKDKDGLFQSIKSSFRRTSIRSGYSSQYNKSTTHTNKSKMAQKRSSLPIKPHVSGQDELNTIQFGSHDEEPKVVQFGAPDEEPKVVQFGAPDEEPKVVQFGAPDEKSEVESTDMPSLDDNNEEEDKEESARYELLLAG